MQMARSRWRRIEEGSARESGAKPGVKGLLQQLTPEGCGGSSKATHPLTPAMQVNKGVGSKQTQRVSRSNRV